MDKKILVAMSGGVDSSTAVFLLKRAGYEVAGVTFKMCSEENHPDYLSLKDTLEKGIRDAADVAKSLDIKHYVFDCSKEFKEQVMDRFAEEYIRGLTPNPCVICNRYVKFKTLYDKADELGYSYAATGHYVRNEHDVSSKRWLLKKGKDISKDQSYMLYSLSQEQLSRTLFPLGEFSKKQIRKIAEENGLTNADKPDSQDICFIPEADYKHFIEKAYGYMSKPGDFVTAEGKVLGTHKGVIGYTSGQRRGLGISSENPLYVVRKDVNSNTILLGGENDLYSKLLKATDVNFIAFEKLIEPRKVSAKVRYSQKTNEAIITPVDNKNVLVQFEAPQRAITPGQAVVFYDGDIVIGGGTIS